MQPFSGSMLTCARPIIRRPRAANAGEHVKWIEGRISENTKWAVGRRTDGRLLLASDSGRLAARAVYETAWRVWTICRARRVRCRARVSWHKPEETGGECFAAHEHHSSRSVRCRPETVNSTEWLFQQDCAGRVRATRNGHIESEQQCWKHERRSESAEEERLRWLWSSAT